MPMKTQSEELVETMTPLLVADGLLLQEDALRLKAKLATGGMKSSDWLLAVEKALEKETSQ